MATIGLVHDTPTPSTNDGILKTTLEAAGHTVIYIDETASPPSSGYDAFVISESGSSGSVAPYKNVTVGVVVLETSWSAMGVTTANASTSASGTTWRMQAHQITTDTGFTVGSDYGIHANGSRYGVNTSTLSGGTVAQSVNPVATSHATVIACPTGGALTPSGTAAARRVCMGLIDARVGGLTADGKTLFTKAVEWAVGPPTTKQGSGTGTFTYAGTASGVSPDGGLASGFYAFATAAATGSRQSRGTGPAQAAYAFPGTATGVNGEINPNLPASMGTGHIEPESHSYCAPIVDTNGNIYRVTESVLAAKNQPRMMKSADGGETWTEMDAANRPGTDTDSIGDLESAWMTYETGGFITFTWQRSYVVYSRFRTSDHATNPDTWVANTRENMAAKTASPQYASHTSPTDQSYQWVFYGDGNASRFKSRTGVSDYGTETTLDANATGPAAWLGANNVSHVLFRTTANQIHYRTVTSAGTVSNPSTRVDSNGTHSVPLPHARPIIYSTGGSEYVVSLFINSSAALQCVNIVDGTPGAEVAVGSGTVITDPGTTGNQAAVISGDVDGTTVHAIWAEGTTLKHSQRPHGGAWTTPDTLASPGDTVLWTYARLVTFPGGRKALAYTYAVGFAGDDTSTIWYDEIALASPKAGSATGTYTYVHTSSAGIRTPKGDASGTDLWLHTATGSREPVGTGTGTHSWTGTAIGPIDGSGAGTYAWTGAATGYQVPVATGTGTHHWTATTTGARSPVGTGTGTFTYAGSAFGTVGGGGHALATYTYAGTAFGARTSSGTGTGTYTSVGAATGARTSNGTGTGTYAYAGTATGGLLTGGTGTGTHAWVAASATGARTSSGTGTGTAAWVSSADGRKITSGTGTGTFTYAGTATGTSEGGGSGTGTHVWAGTATGVGGRAGAAVGVFSFTGTTNGARPSVGAAVAAVYTWVAVAVGANDLNYVRRPAGTLFSGSPGASIGSGPYGASIDT